MTSFFQQQELNIDQFLRSVTVEWVTYPHNLGSVTVPKNRPKLLQDIKRLHDENKDTFLLPLDEGWGKARRNAIERRIRTLWFDSDSKTFIGDQLSTTSSTRGGDAETDAQSDGRVVVKSGIQLEILLGIHGTTRRLHAARPDPQFRFIFMETSAPESPRLRVTNQLLLKILTYHHVTPYFLNLISQVCQESPTGMTTTTVSDFQALKSFTFPIYSIEVLERSYLDYELVFDLKVIIPPSTALDSEPDITDNIEFWPIIQCAVYHRFDLMKGKSLWILTPPSNNNPDSPWNTSETTRDLLQRFGIPLSPDSTAQCFTSCLSVMTWLADWSRSEYDRYLSTVNEQMQILLLPYYSTRFTPKADQLTLKKYNMLMITLDECIAALESNLDVWGRVSSFYCEDLLQDKRLAGLDLPWLPRPPSPDIIPPRDSRTIGTEMEIENSVEQFSASMSSICDMLERMIARARIIKQSGTRFESATHRFIQMNETSAMTDLTKVTLMFSTITLFLLPVSIVTSVFSTEIVRFGDPERRNTDGFVGNWNAPAFVWWLGSCLTATTLVGVGMRVSWKKRFSLNKGGGSMYIWEWVVYFAAGLRDWVTGLGLIARLKRECHDLSARFSAWRMDSARHRRTPSITEMHSTGGIASGV